MTDAVKNNSIKKKRKNRMLNTGIIILLISIILAKTCYNYLINGVEDNENIKSIVIEIPRGSSTKEIAKILLDKNLIKNEIAFRIVAKLEKKDDSLKAGEYKLDNSMDMYEILDKLENGGIKREIIKFTIPEGFELSQTAQRLSDLGIVDKERFLKISSDIDLFKNDYEFLDQLNENVSLEGFLFPNTYEVYKDSTEEDIIRKMLDEFNDIYIKHIKNTEYYSDFDLNKLITLASIVEREGKIDDERPIMAGVFYNRIKIGKKLESCATVQYILGERKVNLTYNDLEIDSPFNTYKYNGLPPSPIASPGLKSILATLNPDDNEYLYFVLKKDNSGSHIFSTSYKDHLRAKNSN